MLALRKTTMDMKKLGIITTQTRIFSTKLHNDYFQKSSKTNDGTSWKTVKVPKNDPPTRYKKVPKNDPLTRKVHIVCDVCGNKQHLKSHAPAVFHRNGEKGGHPRPYPSPSVGDEDMDINKYITKTIYRNVYNVNGKLIAYRCPRNKLGAPFRNSSTHLVKSSFRFRGKIYAYPRKAMNDFSVIRQLVPA